MIRRSIEEPIRQDMADTPVVLLMAWKIATMNICCLLAFVAVPLFGGIATAQSPPPSAASQASPAAPASTSDPPRRPRMSDVDKVHDPSTILSTEGVHRFFSTGPFLDQSGKDMIEGGGTLLLGSEGEFIGPGHASILRRNGQEWLAHHYYAKSLGGRSRLRRVRVIWDPSGWPQAQP